MVKVAFFEESVEIPPGVEIKISEDNHIVVKGKLGQSEKDFSHARGITFKLDKDKIIFTSEFPRSSTLALIKTIISVIKNLIFGVQFGYTYLCKACFSHFPFSFELDEKNEIIKMVNFLGEKAPRKAKIHGGLSNVSVEFQDDDVVLKGADKEFLGQTAQNLKKACKIRKKDPRVFADGTYCYRVLKGEDVIWEIK